MMPDTWRPIESAECAVGTANGPTILVTDGQRFALAHHCASGWVQYVSGIPILFQPSLSWSPSHWLPVPKLPEAA